MVNGETVFERLKRIAGEPPREDRQTEAEARAGIERVTRIVSGGGGVSRQPTTTISPQSQIQQQKSRATKVITDTRNLINKNVRSLVSNLRNKFNENLRQIKDRNERLKQQLNLKENLDKLKAESLAFIEDIKKIEAGEIIKQGAKDLNKKFLDSPKLVNIPIFRTPDARDFLASLVATAKTPIVTRAFVKQEEARLAGLQKREDALRKKFDRNKISIVDLTSGELRAENFQEFLVRTQPKRITDELLKFISKGKEAITGEPDIPRFPTLTEKFLKDQLDIFIKFGFFSPAISVGVAAKGKPKAKPEPKPKEVKRVTKRNLDALLRASEDSFKKGNLNKDLKKIADDIAKLSEGAEKDIKIQNLKDLVDELVKRDLLKFNPSTQIKPSTPTSPSFLKIDIDITGVPTLPREAVVKAGAAAKAQPPPPKPKVFDKPLQERLLEESQTRLSERFKDIPTTSRFGTLGEIQGRLKTNVNQGKASQAKTRNLEKELARAKTQELQATSPLQKQSAKNKQAQINRQIQLQKQIQDQLTKQNQRSLQLLQQKLTQKFGEPRIFKTIKPLKLKFKIPIFPLIKKKKKIKEEIKKKPKFPIAQLGYNAFARQKGKLIKLNKVPISKTKALNLSSFIVDHSTSAFGKIIRTTKKAQKPLRKIPKGYFKRTIKNYRLFKIVKGKQVPLKNAFIEKRAKRINTLGEKQQLSAARALKKLPLIKKIKKKTPKKMSKPTIKKAFKPDNSMFSKRLKGRKL